MYSIKNNSTNSNPTSSSQLMTQYINTSINNISLLNNNNLNLYPNNISEDIKFTTKKSLKSLYDEYSTFENNKKIIMLLQIIQKITSIVSNHLIKL
jgi:hypothetical protein